MSTETYTQEMARRKAEQYTGWTVRDHNNAARLTPTKCTECGRVFDLTNETDAAEWDTGHDCETQPARDNDLEDMYIMWEALRRLNMRDSKGQRVPMANWQKESDNGK